LPKKFIGLDGHIILKFDFFYAIMFGRVVEKNGYDSLMVLFGGGLCSLSTFCNKHSISEFRLPPVFNQRST